MTRNCRNCVGTEDAHHRMCKHYRGPEYPRLTAQTPPAPDVEQRGYPSNEALEQLWEAHAGHPADFGAAVLEKWGGWQDGFLGYGGSASTAPKIDPVAWINPKADPYAPLDMHFQFQNPHDDEWAPLHTHPANDELRKAAGELIAGLDNGSHCLTEIENLRAELDKGKS